MLIFFVHDCVSSQCVSSVHSSALVACSSEDVICAAFVIDTYPDDERPCVTTRIQKCTAPQEFRNVKASVYSVSDYSIYISS